MVSEQLGGESESGDERARVIGSRPPAAGDGATASGAADDTAVAVAAADSPQERVADQRPATLEGVRIPSRNRQARRLVVTLFSECAWLARPDLPAVARLCELYVVIRRIAERLDRDGLLKKDGEGKRLIGEWRGLMAEARAHEAALGITVAARAQLGVDLGRMQALDVAARAQQLRRERDA